MFQYLQNFSPDDQHFDDFCHSQKSSSCMFSTMSDYDFGYEEDLFKAIGPIIEQPLITLCGEDITSKENEYTYFDSLEDEDFINDLFEEYKDVLVEESSSPSKLPYFELPITNDNIIVKETSYPLGKFTKSVSTDSLISVDVDSMRFISMSFNEMDSKVHGMRRVCSEGYIKPQYIIEQGQETRTQKLSRYRDKKAKRNFSRKIKYACRKTLADGQPRIKGRFAKT